MRARGPSPLSRVPLSQPTPELTKDVALDFREDDLTPGACPLPPWPSGRMRSASPLLVSPHVRAMSLIACRLIAYKAFIFIRVQP